jgi:hypothetical protein
VRNQGVITHGDSMIAAFTFNLSDLVARLEETNQWKWHGRCKAEIGEISLNRLNAELTVPKYFRMPRRAF